METTALTNLNYQQTHFVMSAPDIRHLPSDTGIEVAFAGRSNAGKSSALNTLTNQKSGSYLKTLGRTQLINLFEVADGKRLVDLPGYGYAEVPEEMKRKWQRARRVPRKTSEPARSGGANGYSPSAERFGSADD